MHILCMSLDISSVPIILRYLDIHFAVGPPKRHCVSTKSWPEWRKKKNIRRTRKLTRANVCVSLRIELARSLPATLLLTPAQVAPGLEEVLILSFACTCLDGWKRMKVNDVQWLHMTGDLSSFTNHEHYPYPNINPHIKLNLNPIPSLPLTPIPWRN